MHPGNHFVNQQAEKWSVNQFNNRPVGWERLEKKGLWQIFLNCFALKMKADRSLET
jgi:hypothetical protein